ncbi:uncharacterized protein LOC21394488 [Morus notabilis]|uniref:uncharacterized protein LOC21394488 n=1 Tax=Morus notabilis TaxID=981085 RepID=UPI000CECEC2C|nr:uncharacterized protein LOC21394488 [Morus notabilis]
MMVPLVPSKLPRLKPNYKRDLNPERFPPAGSAIGGGDEEISPLLSQVERPKINIFTVSYPRRKPREKLEAAMFCMMPKTPHSFVKILVIEIFWKCTRAVWSDCRNNHVSISKHGRQRQRDTYSVYSTRYSFELVFDL